MSSEPKPRAKVLVVEDEAYVRDSLLELLRSRGFSVSGASGVEEALKALERSPVDVVLTDLKMPGLTGLDLIRRLQEASPEVPVVVLTGHGSVAAAVECLRAGASDFVLKPADPGALEVVLERALQARALRREVRYLRGALASEERPVGESPAWARVIRMVEAAAPTGSTVLLRGESGTGKELLARLMHRLSPRAAGPYVRVNCAAVPMELWESEFFGHRKGSFTGAAADREGRFHLADGGTLFLDEVGAMPLPAQAKLLRAIQDGEFDRVGDEQPTRVDVRIVAATNSDLEADIKAGRLRQDLYYRLAVLQIQVPPLRERPEDIPLLAARFAAEVARRLGRPAPELSPEAAARLQAYPWPGNVRELQNVIERALILNPGEGLDQLDIAPEAAVPAPRGGSEPAGDLNLRATLNRHERELLLEAQRRSGGVRKETARLLGIDPRNLAYYLHKHGLDPNAGRD
ncbi:MAG TPA: sigma-54 dependent transcriptional regulator [Vicinamibacteria bacterium]|nr:sigma-54 dependent transcriptional regulator [Vicinamibacteria bacterium]